MRIVPLLDEGTSYRDIEEKLGAAPSTVSRWKQRFRYIRFYQKTAKPFHWKYSDLRKRIPAW
jgi:uncharacterized protein YerC